MKHFITLIALTLGTTAAMAQEATLHVDNFKSTLSRAEVRAEVRAAMANNEPLAWGEAQTYTPQVPASTLTRAEVRATTLAAIANGEQLLWGEARTQDHLQPMRHRASMVMKAGNR